MEAILPRLIKFYLETHGGILHYHYQQPKLFLGLFKIIRKIPTSAFNTMIITHIQIVATQVIAVELCK